MHWKRTGTSLDHLRSQLLVSSPTSGLRTTGTLPTQCITANTYTYTQQGPRARYLCQRHFQTQSYSQNYLRNQCQVKRPRQQQRQRISERTATLGGRNFSGSAVMKARHESLNPNPYPFPSHPDPTPYQIFHLLPDASEEDVKSRCESLPFLFRSLLLVVFLVIISWIGTS